MDVLQPPSWARPKGFSNGMAGEGRLVFVAGQIGWNPETEAFESDDFADQFRRTLENVVAVLAEAGGKPEHIARLTWYITDKQAYLASLKDLGGHYRDVMGRHFPTMAVVQVVALVEDRAKIEIEATAVVPRG